MTDYKINILERNADKYEIYNYLSLKHEDIKIDPIEKKLFNNDVFRLEDGNFKLLHSSIRLNSNIPGILDMSKTYGRNGKKLIYRCVPDDKRIPVFLIPYNNNKTSFSKVKLNNFVLFKFDNWDSKHPSGIITNTIGTVDLLDNFYEYQLYCKSLHASIQKFTRNANIKLKERTEEEYIEFIRNKYKCVEDRLNNTIYSIDPINSADFDDAYEMTGDANNYTISIYIANVPLWMDALNLWNSFSERIATIYLPDRKRPMLPVYLSDCLCSLQENSKRFAFHCDIKICNNQIESHNFGVSLISVKKNYRYEESELLKNENYKLTLKNINNLCKKYKFTKKVNDSHDMIAYLMIMMNYLCSRKMIESENGIFRAAELIKNNELDLNEDLDEDISQFLKIWYSFGGQYVLFSENIKHSILELDSYIHITSPIRRLVDLLNIIQFQINLGIELSEDSKLFYQNWINKLDYINVTMRAIRKIQCDCSLLNYIFNNEQVSEREYESYLFDKINRNDALFQYIVYIPELKMTSRVTIRDDIPNYSKRNIRIFIFYDEDRLKKKIRLKISS